MAIHVVEFQNDRPYFAEFAYYLWGEVNYDSAGNCRRPSDRKWSVLRLTNRNDHSAVRIRGETGRWTIEGDEPHSSRASHYMLIQPGASQSADSAPLALGVWDHASALARTSRVRETFADARLAPFDHNAFFGSWKWVGWFASEFTMTGRVIMESILTNDTRAVEVCVSWLRDGTANEAQCSALRYALQLLTGLTLDSDPQWVRWYYGWMFKGAGQKQYPAPDIEKWLAEVRLRLSLTRVAPDGRA